MYAICTYSFLCLIRYKDTADYPCSPAFPACPNGSLDTIQVTHANVTVNSDDGNGGTNTSTVDATEAANNIVNCGDTYTCESLAFILLANYSTQYCLGVAPGEGYRFRHRIYINAIVFVEYTGDVSIRKNKCMGCLE